MENYNNIISFGIFAIYTFMFSLFMVPIIGNLKEIKRKLRGLIKSPIIFDSETHEQRTEKKLVKETLNNTLNEYKIEYKELQELRNLIIRGAIITIFAIILLEIWSIIVARTKTDRTSWVDQSKIIKVVYIIIMLILVAQALNKYIPSIGKITEWWYMVDYLSFSPSNIAKYANLYVDYNIGTKKDIMEIRIYSDIELRGYKYRFFIYESWNYNHLYSKIGEVKSNTKLFQAFQDIKDFKQRYVIIGEFNVERFKDKTLKMNFFVFDPCTTDDLCSPYWWFKDYKFEENISSTGYSINPNTNLYQNIKYQGKGLNFKKIYWGNQNWETHWNDEQRDLGIKYFFEKEKKKL